MLTHLRLHEVAPGRVRTWCGRVVPAERIESRAGCDCLPCRRRYDRAVCDSAELHEAELRRAAAHPWLEGFTECWATFWLEFRKLIEAAEDLTIEIRDEPIEFELPREEEEDDGDLDDQES